MITQSAVSEFKRLYCDENRIITRLLKNRLGNAFIEPILDVGSGLGDITASAFPDKRVIHLDILDYSAHSLPDSHSWAKGDFFDFIPAGSVNVGTMLFCHVLQFLDDDLDRLNAKVRTVSPAYIVTVTNCNDEYMKELLSWVEINFAAPNPEVDLPGFPAGYALDGEIPFVGIVRCEDYAKLANQVIYLMDALPSTTERKLLEERLKKDLSTPTLRINQTIKVYKKHE